MKQLYYKETPVEIGQIINVNNINVLVNESLIENNPLSFSYKFIQYVKLIKDWSVGGEFIGEIFELSSLNNLDKFQEAPSKQDFRKYIEFWISYGYFETVTKEDFIKQELTKEAIKRGFDKCPKWLIYPWQSDPIKRKPNWSGSNAFYWAENDLLYKTVTIYYKGQWAKIVEPLLTTDDGVELFIGDTIWIISKKDFSYSSKILNDDSGFGKIYFKRSEFMYYSREDLVHKYIKNNKPKTLEDYENILLLNDNLADTDLENDIWEMYAWLKRNEPKLYWSKILELIADDLNQESQIKLKEDTNNSYYNVNRGYVLFKSRVNATKALDLMRSKLDYIYK